MTKHELLSQAACRQMTQDLIERHNRLAGVLTDLAGLAPTLAESKEVAQLGEELSATRRRMKRPRYPVIFCGRSQVGKSTTLSNIVRAPKGQEPCIGGSGAATTCVVTRIHAKPRPEAEPSRRPIHDCSIRFLTYDEYESRVGGIRESLGYAPNMAGNDVLNHLSGLLDAPARRPDLGAGNRDDEAQDHVDRQADRKYLRRLMRSHAQHGGQVVVDGAEGLTQPGEFARRIEYTNHPDNDAATLYTLLGEVEIAYEVDPAVLDSRIELVDSPGLGARLISDDLVTKRILPAVEGALIVIDVSNVAIREVYELLEDFGRRFGTLRGRVWLLVTKLDSLTDTHYRPESGPDGTARSIFDHIAGTARENNLPLEQVVLLSNEYHRHLPRGADDVPAAATSEMMRVMLKLELDEAGEPVLPDSVRRYPELERAFREVIRDGGIDRIRRIVGSELADQVQDRTRAAVKRDLDRMTDQLRNLLEAARRVSQLERGAFRHLGEWIGDIDGLMREIKHDLEGKLIEGPGRELIDAVWTSDWKVRFPDHLNLLNGTPLKSHDVASRHLCNFLRDRARAETIPKVFDNIGARLLTSEATHGPIPLGSDEGGPASAWRKEKADYMNDSNSPFLRVVDEAMNTEGPFVAVVAGQPSAGLSDRDYRELMKEKLEIVTREAIFTLGDDVLARLKRIREDLNLIGHLDRDAVGSRGGPNAQAPSFHDKLLETLCSESPASATPPPNP